MSEHIRGLHSLTAISGAPQASIEFAVRVMGLRMVKRTVNFDDPQTYNLIFGNPFGEIGTLIGLLPWRGAGSAYHGNGSARTIAYRVPSGSLPAWHERLAEADIQATIAGEELTFTDPFELAWVLQEDASVTADNAPAVWEGSPTDPDTALLGLGDIAHTTHNAEKTREFFETLGASTADAAAGFRVHFPGGDGAANKATLAFTAMDEQQDPRHGAGSILKTTLAVSDEDALRELHEQLKEKDYAVSTVRNRLYWKVFFMQEPGGSPIEFATTGPGLTVDEPLDELGLAFRLPEWLEQDREFLRSRLPVTASPEYADRFRRP